MKFPALTKTPKQTAPETGAVLAATTVKPTIKFNANGKVTGSLVVDSTINGIKLALLPEANEATINAKGDINLDQDVSTSGSPTFAGLTVNSPIKAPSLNGGSLALTGSSNQVVFNYDSASKGTLTWTPTAARTLTLPDVTDTLVGKTTTDTLSNKTIKSGDSNTISGSYPDITGITSLGTVSTGTWNGTKIGTGYGGTGLTGYTTGDILYASATNTLSKLTIGSSGQSLIVSGGLPGWGAAAASGVTSLDSLTGALTISNTSGSGTTITIDDASTTAKGIASFSSTNFSVSSGAVNTIQNIATSATPTFVGLNTTTGNLGIGTSAAGARLAVNGNGILGWGTTSIVGPTNGLAVFGNVGIGTTSPAYTLDVTGSGNFTGSLTVSGSIIGASSGTSGYWSRTGTTLTPVNTGDALSLTGLTTIVPSSGSGTALTVRSAPSGSSNILDITNNAGTTSYFSIDSSGQLTGSAFKITDAANVVVGTAIEGGWTLNSNPFTYRRSITVTNNDGSNALPVNYEVTVTLSAADSSQVYSKSQQSSPYKDFRIGYYNGSTYTEIARNISSFTSSNVTFTFLLQTSLAASGATSNYFIYYRNTTLATTPSTYTSSVTLDNSDTVSQWSSGATGFALSQETTIKQEGTGSVKMVATSGSLGTFSTTNQGQLPQALSSPAVVTQTIGSSQYVYILGGNNGSDQSTVYKSTVDSSGNAGAFATTSQGQLPQALSGLTSFSLAPFLDTGTGADGSIDLSLGSGAGGCTGTGLAWTAGTSTCTITTATKSTFNFTTVTIPSGTTLTTDSSASFLTLKATGAVTINGTTDLNGKGGTGGNGGSSPTAGTGNGGGSPGWSAVFWPGGGGGGHGGAGGNGAYFSGQGPSGGITYGTTFSSDVGSGGGGGYTANGYSPSPGGTGGGGLKINSAGNVTVSGNITANGSIGTAGYWSGGGGGSGGKIIIQATGSITLAGEMNARGGNGADNNCDGGGGGGGRITLIDNNGSVSGTTSVAGGTVVNGVGCGGANPTDATAGAVGVVTISSNYDFQMPSIYIIGGTNAGTAQNTVYKATIDGSGNIGTFATTSQGQLPQALTNLASVKASVSSTNYVYALGGKTGSADSTAQLTVYKSTVDTSGNLGTFATTSQGQLPQALSSHAATTITISGTTYVYVLGGKNTSGTAQTTVYKSTIDGSANLGTFATTSQGQLPQALFGLSAFTATVGSGNYIYVIGGNNGTTNQTTVYKAPIDASGNIGTFVSTYEEQLSTGLSASGVVNATVGSNQYAYLLGGTTGSAVATVYRSPINDMSTYTATKTISTSDLSSYNGLQFGYYSTSLTGSLMTFAINDTTGGWQSCSFSAGSAGSWLSPKPACNIASMTRSSVTQIRFTVASNQTSDFTTYFDNIQALPYYYAGSSAPTVSNASAILGANNLAINAQGTGLVQINYAASTDPQAGSGGFAVYNGGTTPWFTVNASGNIGIGTTVPYSKLQIQGSGTSTGLSFLTTDSALTQRFAILDNGNVGIGTTNPLTSLYITGNTMIGYASGGPGSLANGLAVSGNLGIGTSSPSSKLNVIGNVGIGTSAAGAALSVNGGGLFGWGTASVSLSSGTVLGVNGNIGIGSTTANSSLSVTGNAHIGGLFQGISAPANGLFVDGNVGIGATTSSNKLDVWGNSRIAGTLTVDSTATLGSGLIGYSGVTALSNGLAVRGNIGIGTTTANSNLSISGNAHIGSLYQGISAPTNGLFVDGNVGIGATTSSNKLDVWGNSRIAGTLTLDSTITSTGGLLGYSPGTILASGTNLAVSGNVGIGTTSPAGALHVVGQCVTGDTKLKRRRRRRKGKLDDGNWKMDDEIGSLKMDNPTSNLQHLNPASNFKHQISNEEWEDVRIDQIQPGDEILTLDEKTGEFVTSRVKALKEMGIHQTYLLITDSGKTIRTTKEHPYFAREAKNTIIFGGTYEVDQSPRMEDLNKDSFVALANRDIHFIIRVSKEYKRQLYKVYLKEDKVKLFAPELFARAINTLLISGQVKPDRLKIDIEYPNYEERITQIITLKNNLSVSYHSLGHSSASFAHWAAYRAFKGEYKTAINIYKEGFEAKEKDRGTLRVGLGVVTLIPLNQIRNARDLTGLDYHKLEDLSTPIKSGSSAKWLKVYDLKPGMEIATVDGWEKIVAVKEFAREQVFDIEVEGTHNFVGNDIVAHNTTIFEGGNVGIGTSNPQYTLEVNGTGKLNDSAWTYASDRRLKENIASVSAGLSIIEQLNPVTFDYINGGKSRAGFIAQEVQSILPNLVSTGSDGMLGIRLEELMPYAVKAIQEQQKQINGLLAQQTTNSTLLAGLSVNPDGTLNAPKLNADHLTISADLNFATSALASLLSATSSGGPKDGSLNDSQGGFDSSEVGEVSIDLLSSLNSISTAVLGIQSQESTTSARLATLEAERAQLASLESRVESQESRAESQESRVKSLEDKLASMSAQLANTSTQTKTPEVPQSTSGVSQSSEEASTSAQIATNSAQVTGDSGQQATPSATVSNCTLYPEACTLNLTPPSILLATTSAQLVDLEVTSDATISGQLTAYDLNIQNSLKSLGTTTLGRTLVAGDFTVDGMLTVTGDSINSLSTLYIQNSSLAGPIDFFNGQIILTKDGTISAKTIQSDKLILGVSTLGSGIISAGQTETIIETSAITSKSKVFVTAQNEINTPLFIINKIIGKSFKVKIKVPAYYDIFFDWSILDSP